MFLVFFANLAYFAALRDSDALPAFESASSDSKRRESAPFRDAPLVPRRSLPAQ